MIDRKRPGSHQTRIVPREADKVEKTLSTEILAEKDRLPYWRDVVCATFVELECDGIGSNDFFGSMSNSAIGDIQIPR